ncbi:MAG: hypothetical protein HKM95_14010 [Inquilinus sp.]|nr:hypothetical protein [Inquilinus sp.]
MSDQWQFQLRVTLAEPFAALSRQNPDDPALAPLAGILRRHGAALNCQFDAFAGYVAEAEARGTEKYPLYAWTKATIEDPAKQAKYIKSFTLYVDGDEVYARAKADALEAELKPLVGGAIVTGLARHDTNPANNPQPPKRYRK